MVVGFVWLFFCVCVSYDLCRQCDGVVNMVMEAFVHIHEERYYSALNTVDQINQRLDAMDSAKFASQLRRWMPSLTEMINKATKEEVRVYTRAFPPVFASTLTTGARSHGDSTERF